MRLPEEAAVSRGRYQNRPDPVPSVPTFAWHPECFLCAWVWWGGRFKLKFVNRLCADHGRLLDTAPVYSSEEDAA